MFGFALDLKDLSIGSYLHCKVVDNGLDKNIGRSQVIKISVDPELVCGAMVGFIMHLLAVAVIGDVSRKSSYVFYHIVFRHM